MGECSKDHWKDLLQNHFENSSQGASLLVLKNLQLMASSNSDTELSEEGLLLWKDHFATQPDSSKLVQFHYASAYYP